jgi:hypothetical protein
MARRRQETDGEITVADDTAGAAKIPLSMDYNFLHEIEKLRRVALRASLAQQ